MIDNSHFAKIRNTLRIPLFIEIFPCEQRKRYYGTKGPPLRDRKDHVVMLFCLLKYIKRAIEQYKYLDYRAVKVY